MRPVKRVKGVNFRMPDSGFETFAPSGVNFAPFAIKFGFLNAKVAGVVAKGAKD